MSTETTIGVHCTHGINRTGYLVCRYMIQRLGWIPEEAIAAFGAARGHPIERANYLADLKRSSWQSIEEGGPPPPPPTSASRSKRPSEDDGNHEGYGKYSRSSRPKRSRWQQQQPRNDNDWQGDNRRRNSGWRPPPPFPPPTHLPPPFPPPTHLPPPFPAPTQLSRGPADPCSFQPRQSSHLKRTNHKAD